MNNYEQDLGDQASLMSQRRQVDTLDPTKPARQIRDLHGYFTFGSALALGPGLVETEGVDARLLVGDDERLGLI